MKPGARRAPTEAEILDAARELLDTGGPAAASIRRIAAAVGVPPNAVYTFFPDRSAVERALVEQLLGEVELMCAAAGRAGWRAGVEQLAVDLRAHLEAHPGAVPLLLAERNALFLRECLLDLLGAGGLTPAVATRGAYLVVVYVLGAVAVEVGTEQYVWGQRRVLDGLASAAT